MSDEEDPIVELLKRILAEMLRRSDAAAIAQLATELDTAVSPMVVEGEVVLFGFEGQVDAVWRVPDLRPERLRRPIEPRLTASAYAEPPSPNIRIAEYQRVSESTYVRVS